MILYVFCCSWAIGVTVLPQLLLPRGKCLPFFDILQKVLTLRTLIKTWYTCRVVHACARSRQPKLSVSKKVEAVGHCVTPYRHNTPWQEKPFLSGAFVYLIS